MIELFDRLHGLSEGFSDITTANIRSLFPNPTLVQLDGESDDYLFVSILLHGNEYSGLRVMQHFLQQYADGLPRSILMFVGNVRAAEANLALAGELRAPVCAERAGGIVFAPGPVAAAIEDIVGRNMQEGQAALCRRGGHGAGRVAVDARRQVFFFLGLVDGGIGGGVDNRVRGMGRNDRGAGVRVRQIGGLTIKRDDLMGLPCQGTQLSRDLAVVTKNQNVHTCSLSLT